MNLWKSMAGMVTVELTSAEVDRTLQRILSENIVMYNLVPVNLVSVRFAVLRRDCKLLFDLCQHYGDRVRVIDRAGLFWLGKRFAQRPVLVLGLTALFALVMFLPGRILLVEVEGNTSVPSQRILEVAQDCGISFGASRRTVRSEQVKNRLLEEMEELKWAGVNTYGCRAVISVREREVSAGADWPEAMCSMVAARDGFVTSCIVTSGTGLCAPGDTVTKGQLLISAYRDCGICIRLEGAEGEVFAQTNHILRVATPEKHLIRRKQGRRYRRFSVLLGKKRINLWKGSGISDASCGRMYKEYIITLPGGFLLPVSIAVETVTEWETEEAVCSQADAARSLERFAEDCISGRMLAGRILQQTHNLVLENGRWLLDSRFVCNEMIGKMVKEKIGDTNEQNS